MSVRRRPYVVASAMIASAMLLAGCGGQANGRGSTDPSATDSTSSTSASSSAAPSDTATSPTETSTPDPYAITCDVISQSQVDQWTRGGEPARVEAVEDGCRVVSSDPEGALMIQWRFLDVPNSGDDAGLVDEINKTGDAVDLGTDLTAVRSASNVDPTRKTRLYVTFDNSRTLYVEATATLDRPRSLTDLREMATAIVLAYAERPGLPTEPVETD